MHRISILKTCNVQLAPRLKPLRLATIVLVYTTSDIIFGVIKLSILLCFNSLFLFILLLLLQFCKCNKCDCYHLFLHLLARAKDKRKHIAIASKSDREQKLCKTGQIDNLIIFSHIGCTNIIFVEFS